MTKPACESVSLQCNENSIKGMRTDLDGEVKLVHTLVPSPDKLNAGDYPTTALRSPECRGIVLNYCTGPSLRWATFLPARFVDGSVYTWRAGSVSDTPCSLYWRLCRSFDTIRRQLRRRSIFRIKINEFFSSDRLSIQLSLNDDWV